MTLMPVMPGSQSTLWRLDNAVADSVTLDLKSGTALGAAKTFRWAKDGSKLFAVENNSADGSYLYYWNCSSEWDLDTAVYAGRIALNQADGTTIENGQPYESLDFNPDGSEVTILQGGTLRTWSFSAPYVGSTTRIATFTMSGINISFSDDGLKLTYYRDGRIRSRAMSSAHDIATLGAEANAATIAASSIAPARLGTRVLTVESNVAKEYRVATAYDFSTLILTESFDPGATVTFGAYADNGSKLYLMNGNVITQYTVTG